MRVVFECHELVGVLSSALDAIRRIGIEIASVIGGGSVRGTSLELLMHEPAASPLSTPRERITLIEGVRSVLFKDETRSQHPHLATCVRSADAHREG